MSDEVSRAASLPGPPAAGRTPVLTNRAVNAERVKAIVFMPMSDALRNHLVTLAYVDMGKEMATLLGQDDANWTCLAVWPSFTVGETIRAGNDPLGLKRVLGLVQNDPLGFAREQTTRRVLGQGAVGGRVLNRSIAAGNRGVFFEIGLCWADFLATFGTAPLGDDDRRAAFAKFRNRINRVPLPPGRLWPAGNREQLAKGFEAYLDAMTCDDPKRKAELILLGNICMGDHEQARLQGWLDLSMLDPIRILVRPIRVILPSEVIARVERGWSLVMTRRVFVVKMAQETIRVGRPVPPAHAPFPAPLDTLEDDDVRAEYERVVNAAGGAQTGAHHWNDFDDRMSFIAALFRARQRAGLVGISPYTPEQEVQIWAEAARIDALDATFERHGPIAFPPDESSPWPAADAQRLAADLVARLDEGRQQCDPPVDEVIATYYQGLNVPPAERHFTDVMRAVADPDGPEDLPIIRFRREAPVLPVWADLDRIKNAQAFFQTFRPSIHASLFFGSMFLGYAAANGVQVLALVSDLTKTPERRIWESTRFVEDICTTPLWERDSAGWQSLRGVRMFHGSVRSMIESGSEHIKPVDEAEHPTDRVWDPAWGRPINQEEMFGYCLTMAVPTIDNLDRMGEAIEPQQARDWLHFWNVIGVLMGVDESFVTSPVDRTRDLSLEEARYVLDVILARNVGPTVQGRQLAHTLLDQMGWFPGPLRRVARSFIRSSIGDRIADMLGVPHRGLLEPTLSLAQGVARVMRTNAASAATTRLLTRWVGTEFLNWWHDEYRAIPPYRLGGEAAVEERAPDPSARRRHEVSITIGSTGTLPSGVKDSISAVDEVDLRDESDVIDLRDHAIDNGDGDTRTTLHATVPGRHALDDLVAAVRAATTHEDSVHEVQVTIGDRQIALSRLSDEEIAALLPEPSE